MIEDVKKEIDAIQFIKNYWERPYTIIIIDLVIISPLFLEIYKSFNILTDNLFQLKLCIFIIVIIIISIIWFFTTKINNVKKGNIGIVIAINTQNDIVKERFKNDFLENLKTNIPKGTQLKFQFIILSEYKSIKFRDNIEKYIKKIRSHYFIFGYFCIRKSERKEFYYLKLNTAVKHYPIPIEVSKKFSKDIEKVFPKENLISIDNEIIEFKITTENISISSKYIMGIASYLSRDIITAFDLHYKILEDIENKKIDKSTYSFLKDNLPKFVINESFNLSLYYYKYKKNLDKMNYYLDILKKFDPDNYSAKLFKSIYHFLKNRDIKKAYQELNTIKNANDSIWLYNKAFLLAYENKLNESFIMYKNASQGNISGITLNEIEEFILNIIDLEPDKFQLNLCLGFIYFYDKKDNILAKEYLLKFKEKAKDKIKYIKSLELVEKLLNKIEKNDIQIKQQ